MIKVFIILEGKNTGGYSSLRVGMGQLLQSAVPNSVIRVMPQGSRDEAIKRFKKETTNQKLLLLIDLDNLPAARQKVLQEKNLVGDSEDVFFMVQEMEAWFISQPNVLANHWREDLFKQFLNKQVDLIEKPSQKLAACTRHSRKGPYGKISDGAQLLPKLDPEKLEKDFSDFQNLVARIKALSATS